MTKESAMVGIIGLLFGVIITGFAAGVAVNNGNTGMMNMMGVDTQKVGRFADDESMGMDMMTENLRGKSGDEFDKVFLSEMIVHHQGAIDMAVLAKQSAKHDEIKKLADEIIAAQTKEINDMKS